MLPVRGATHKGRRTRPCSKYFNPCSPCGSDTAAIAPPGRWCDFNPCSPCGERPASCTALYSYHKFQSMLPVRGATGELRRLLTQSAISIHAPRAGSDPVADVTARIMDLFQSMLPVRGATLQRRQQRGRALYFNPCSPCGERLHDVLSSFKQINFNPCSPCGERPAFRIS